jgi:cell division protein FtsW
MDESYREVNCVIENNKQIRRRLDVSGQTNTKNREVHRVSGSLEMKPSYRMNGILLILVIVMISFGLVMLFSASMSDGYANYDGDSTYYVLRQASFTAFGFVVAMFITLMLKVDFYDKMLFVVLLYVMTTGLLLYVAVAGSVINGARRWIRIGSITLQPSELAKVASVFCLAGYFSWRRRRWQVAPGKRRSRLLIWLKDGWADILVPAFAMLIWLVLIVRQPHLSGFLIMSFIIFTVFLTAGMPARSWLSGIMQFVVFLVVIALIVGALLPVYLNSTDQSMNEFMEKMASNFEHVGHRLEMFSNPDEADSDDVYQITQAIIALGSGGLQGVGLGKGRQKYNYLPEAHNDYVFAIIGEELGFIGTVIVLLLFVAFLISGVMISLRAKNNYTAMLAAGYTGLISIQAFLNMGVATRLLPSTGISLPFFSYGGTSNIFFLVAVGFLLAVSRTGQQSRRKNDAARQKPQQSARRRPVKRDEGQRL